MKDKIFGHGFLICRSWMSSLLAIALCFSLFASCGKNSAVKLKQFKLEEVIRDQSVWLLISAELDLGQMTLPGIQGKLPLKHPKIGDIGSISMFGQKISVELNLGQLLRLNLEQALLPNGEALPLIADQEVVVIPIKVSAQAEIFVYVALTKGSKALGITFPIAELDRLGAELKTPSALFPLIRAGEVHVYPGLYTSPNAGDNGMGLFVDLTTAFRRLSTSGHWYETREELSLSASRLNYTPIRPSPQTEQRLVKQLLRWNQDRTQLRFE